MSSFQIIFNNANQFNEEIPSPLSIDISDMTSKDFFDTCDYFYQQYLIQYPERTCKQCFIKKLTEQIAECIEDDNELCARVMMIIGTLKAAGIAMIIQKSKLTIDFEMIQKVVKCECPITDHAE
ncbi:hypothetical protein L0B53_13035 [Vibrio sp. SS-MA-C1-2]|uniref:hypothetical protein n=1 Tax=Vibrio sp. SS-MA-C1-2 TaxID=2908646 RepID=UPI001F31D96A|nr:hypothetical protein [Vibrio sp. SS-MA-C1-2]UJF17946.1 hypothetical protein L0B53_13035 [Vibrio sp. SS-MA-C1-2]